MELGTNKKNRGESSKENFGRRSGIKKCGNRKSKYFYLFWICNMVSEKGGVKEEIKYRITRESPSAAAFTRSLRSKIISKPVKIGIY